MAELDTWKLPAPQPQPKFEREPVEFVQFIKCALAACLVVGVGFLGGHLSAPTPDAAALSAAMAPEMEKLSAALGAKLAEDRRTTTALLESLESQRAGDYVVLRRALETLAVNIEDSLESAQRQIVQLATTATLTPR